MNNDDITNNSGAIVECKPLACAKFAYFFNKYWKFGYSQIKISHNPGLALVCGGKVGKTCKMFYL